MSERAICALCAAGGSIEFTALALVRGQLLRRRTCLRYRLGVLIPTVVRPAFAERAAAATATTVVGLDIGLFDGWIIAGLVTWRVLLAASAGMLPAVAPGSRRLLEAEGVATAATWTNSLLLASTIDLKQQARDSSCRHSGFQCSLPSAVSGPVVTLHLTTAPYDGDRSAAAAIAARGAVLPACSSEEAIWGGRDFR